jgi:hypothetical protein
MPVFAVIGAVAGVASGIAGGVQASQNNARATANQEAQEEFNEKTADLTNEYNDELDVADKANYEAMREYSHDMSMQNWQRGAEIQDYKYLQTLKQYAKSQQIAGQQVELNNLAGQQAVESEEASIEDMFLQQQFDRESQLSALKGVYTEGNLNIREEGVKMLGIQSKQRLGTASINNQIETLMKQGSFDKTNALVKGLMAEGRAAMGQAGKSKAKRQQSASAALHRGLMALENELTGKRKAAGIELAQLSTETSLAKTGVGLNLERIENSMDSAEADAEFNNRVLTANMKSFISQAERNVKDIHLQQKFANLNAEASAMIKPERLSYDPVPTQEPERIFVDRMEAIPGFVPQAAQQSVWAPVIKGIGAGASALVGVDFGPGKSKGGGGGGGSPLGKAIGQGSSIYGA